MPAVRQKPGLAMQRFVPGRVWFRHWHRRAPAGRHAKKSAAGFTKAKQDSAVAVPSAAAECCCPGCESAEYLRRTSGDVDLMQLAPCKEGEKAAVGRPEGS